MFCQKCGTQMSDDQRFCGNCGFEVPAVQEVQPVKTPQQSYNPQPSPMYQPPVGQPVSAQKPKKKLSAILIAVVAVVLVFAIGFGVFLILPPGKYVRAVVLTKLGMDDVAIKLVHKLDDEKRKDFLVVSERTVYDDCEDDYDYDAFCEYDKDGNLLRKEYDYGDGEIIVYTYTYDDDGNCIKEMCNEDGESYVSEESVYDEDGNLLSYISYFSDGDTYESIYEYDEDGYVISRTYIFSGDDKTTYNYEYDSDHKIIRAESFDDEEKEKDIYTYEYDSDDHLISKVVNYSFGSTGKYEYKYDEDGNMIEDSYTYSNGDKDITLYEYNDDGLLIRETTRYSEGDEYTFEYSGFQIFYRPDLNDKNEDLM